MALGALHGPTELLPISSSGHTTVIPWLLGSPYAELAPELRKALEVALHGGAAAGLLVGRRREVVDELRHLDRRQLTLTILASAPAGVAGLWFERSIETKLGNPRTIAVGLFAGALAMAAADTSRRQRAANDARAVDAAWLGLAQACALMPGISRNGATLAAARALGFSPPEAELLSRRLAYPVIAGATALKAWRLRRSAAPGKPAAKLAAGALASFGSTLLTLHWVDHRLGGGRLLPYAVYRIGLAVIIVARLRREPVRTAQNQGQAELM